MNPNDAKLILRERGLCGHMVSDTDICVLPAGHDDGAHDRGWTVSSFEREAPYGRDSREATTEYRVSDGVKAFYTSDAKHAQWLASTLTRLDL